MDHPSHSKVHGPVIMEKQIKYSTYIQYSARLATYLCKKQRVVPAETR